MMPEWRFFLSKSPAPGADPRLALQRIAFLRAADDRTISIAVSRGGEVGFSYPMVAGASMSEAARQLHPTIIAGLFSGVDYCIECERNRNIVWSGPLSNNQGSTTTTKGGRTAIKVEGWRQLLALRELREDVTYGASNNYMYLSGAVAGQGTTLPAGHTAAEGVAWHDWEIVQDLINKIIGYDPAHAPPIRWRDHTGTPQVRQMSWKIGTDLDQCFRDLEELEAGCDVVISPTTREITVVGWDAYADHPELVFGFGRPPFNITNFGWQVDFMGARNRMPINGQNLAPALAQDTGSQDRFGLMEESVDLTGATTTDQLLYYGNEEVALRAFPVVFYNFVPMQSGKKGMPQLFEEFNIGEGCRMNVDYGPFDIVDQQVRAFSVALSIGKEGQETITQFQTTFSGA